MTWLLRGLLAVAVLVVGTGVVAWRLLVPECANGLVSEAPSPDGIRKVVVFTRDCGATTAASLHASLVAADAALPSAGGNLFVADGLEALHVEWPSPRAVVLTFDRAARVFKAMAHVDDVDASYVPMP